MGSLLNDVNCFMDLERELHKKCYQIPMALVQRVISSIIIRCVGAWGLTEIYQILSNNVTFEVRPLCNLTRCTSNEK